MNEKFKYNLSGLLYNMYFGSYELEDDLSHSKKGQTWKKHKYIKKVNGKYIYPKGTSGLNTKRQKASRYKWDNRYNTEASKYNATTIGKVKMYKRPDGTVVVTYPGYNAWTLPPGTNTNALSTRLKNLSNTYKESGSNEVEARNNFTKALEGAISGSGSSGTPTSSSGTTSTQNQEAPKQEAPKQEAPKQEAPKQEAPKQEAPKQEANQQQQNSNNGVPDWYNKKTKDQQKQIDQVANEFAEGIRAANEYFAEGSNYFNMYSGTVAIDPGAANNYFTLYSECMANYDNIMKAVGEYADEQINNGLLTYEEAVDLLRLLGADI